MPGPCPNNRPTEATHADARCRDKDRCTGPGCRVRRAKRTDPIAESLQTDAE